MRPVRIAIIGFGKIAADQHVPAIADNPRFELVASSSRSGQGSQALFTDWRELIAKRRGAGGGGDHHPASAALRDCSRVHRGRPALPARKTADREAREIDALACLAEDSSITLYTSWHAQHNPAVEPRPRRWPASASPTMRIIWHEDVHKWHPGQQWIWEPGGFGVFDPGINAFSIATRIFPGTLLVRSAELCFPDNAQTPIAAEIDFASEAADGPLRCSLDWRRTEGEEWTIDRADRGWDRRAPDGWRSSS